MELSCLSLITSSDWCWFIFFGYFMVFNILVLFRVMVHVVIYVIGWMKSEFGGIIDGV